MTDTTAQLRLMLPELNQNQLTWLERYINQLIKESLNNEQARS